MTISAFLTAIQTTFASVEIIVALILIMEFVRSAHGVDHIVVEVFVLVTESPKIAIARKQVAMPSKEELNSDREQETMNQAELKPCPFCGSNARFSMMDPDEEEQQEIQCINPKCPAVLFVHAATEELALKAWNTRPDHERSASHALMQVKQAKDALIAAERTLTDLGAKIPAFTFTSLDGSEVEISLASAQRGYGHHLREIARLKSALWVAEVFVAEEYEVRRASFLDDGEPYISSAINTLEAIRSALPLREQGGSDGE